MNGIIRCTPAFGVVLGHALIASCTIKILGGPYLFIRATGAEGVSDKVTHCSGLYAYCKGGFAPFYGLEEAVINVHISNNYFVYYELMSS